MLPQKNYDKLERDIEEIKLTLNSLTNNMSNLKELTEEIKGLKKLLSKQEKITTQLQQRVDDLEQYSRKDEVNISGLVTRHHSYARMANPSEAVGEDAPSEELQTLEEQVTDFFQQQVVPADVQQQVKEESPEEWSPGVDQQDSEPPHVKEGMRTSWEEEQQEAKEETDDLKSSFTEAPLKSEDDEEKPLFSPVHQHPMADGDLPTSSSADQMMAAAGGAETSRNPDLFTHDDGSSFAETKVSEDDEEKLLFSQPHQHLMVAGDLPTSSSVDQMMAAAAGAETSRNPDLNIHDDDSSSSEMDVSKDDKDGSSSVRESKNEDSELKRETPVSGVTNRSFSCSECGRQFVNLRLLQRYSTCSLRIICSNCLFKNKHFKRKTLVSSCRTVQTIQESFICEDCGKIFTKNEYLNRHRRIHTGHKPFACDVCGQRFNDQSNCQSHMKIHSKQKLYVCNACGQRFSQKSHLNAHMRIHTGQKPFVCDVCGQRFSNKSKFRSHKRVHT